MSYLRQHRVWLAIVWLAVGVITATQVVVGMAALGRHLNWVSLFFRPHHMERVAQALSPNGGPQAVARV